jgi:hypothetical protein
MNPVPAAFSRINPPSAGSAHTLCRRLQNTLLVLGLACQAAGAPGTDPAPPPTPGDLSPHAFPALGAPAQRRVVVEWNRFYDTQGLQTLLANLHQAFPELTRLYSIGQSVQGRELWCLEVTSRQGGEPNRKPGMYIDGNIHGNEVQGSEVVAYTAWYLCHQYGRIPKVTELLDRCVFYLLPTINPDGRDEWLHRPHNSSTSRSGLKAEDDDQDGTADEDGYDDLDGDGAITSMRIRDPRGRYRPHPDFPDQLMVPAPPDEFGTFTLLGQEGLDNDGDGRVNEDPPGGYDMNRDWGYDWQPGYVQRGAREYPFCLPETRAVARFVLAHPNIAGAQSYHNAMGAILRSPGREGGTIQPGDDQVMQTIGQRGERMLPFYRSLVIWKDLYTVWGGEVDWFYSGRGILTFTTELWTRRNLDRTPAPAATSGSAPTMTGPGAFGSGADDATFQKLLLLREGVTPWHPFDHPVYGAIEIGGAAKTWGRTPPSFLLEEECHRNMAFTLYHADHLPRVSLDEIAVDRLDAGLFRVRVVVSNSRLIPTRTDQDVRNHIGPPDRVLLSGPQVQVRAAGIARDRFYQRVEPVKRRPERVELDHIPGMGQQRVQFIVSGAGTFTVTFESAKGGLHERTVTLP